MDAFLRRCEPTEIIRRDLRPRAVASRSCVVASDSCPLRRPDQLGGEPCTPSARRFTEPSNWAGTRTPLPSRNGGVSQPPSAGRLSDIAGSGPLGGVEMDDDKPRREKPEDQPHEPGAEGGSGGSADVPPAAPSDDDRRWATPTSIPTPTRDGLAQCQRFRGSVSRIASRGRHTGRTWRPCGRKRVAVRCCGARPPGVKLTGGSLGPDRANDKPSTRQAERRPPQPGYRGCRTCKASAARVR